MNDKDRKNDALNLDVLRKIGSNPKSSQNSIDALSVELRTPILALCSCDAAIVLS